MVSHAGWLPSVREMRQEASKRRAIGEQDRKVKEAEAAASINSTHVVGVFDTGEEDAAKQYAEADVVQHRRTQADAHLADAARRCPARYTPRARPRSRARACSGPLPTIGRRTGDARSGARRHGTGERLWADLTCLLPSHPVATNPPATPRFVIPNPTFPSPPFERGIGNTIRPMQWDLQSPRLHVWNVCAQRQLPGAIVATVGTAKCGGASDGPSPTARAVSQVCARTICASGSLGPRVRVLSVLGRTGERVMYDEAKVREWLVVDDGDPRPEWATPYAEVVAEKQ